MNMSNMYIHPYIILAIQGLLAWALWSIRKAFVHSEVYTQHVHMVQNQYHEFNLQFMNAETRIQNLEERLSQAPDSSTLNHLTTAMESLRGDLKTLDMRITGIDRLMQRLEHALDKQIRHNTDKTNLQ